ncbi:MAG: DUF7134 domain-containing protein [Candidatus Dormibacteria bacterium]
MTIFEPSARVRDPGCRPKDVGGGLFELGQQVMHAHPLGTDSLRALLLLGGSTLWLALSPIADLGTGLLQAALVGLMFLRRVRPLVVVVAATGVALAKFILDCVLIGDAALLVVLYTVAVHEPRSRTVLAAVVRKDREVMATVRWPPVDTVARSLRFLTAKVVAAICAGLTIASGSQHVTWLDEQARRLEMARDQQAPIAAHAERTRIARELHDIVARSLSVVITVADAALVVSEATVKSHGGRILTNLELRDRVQTVVLAYEADLVRPGIRSPFEGRR